MTTFSLEQAGCWRHSSYVPENLPCAGNHSLRGGLDPLHVAAAPPGDVGKAVVAGFDPEPIAHDEGGQLDLDNVPSSVGLRCLARERSFDCVLVRHHKEEGSYPLSTRSYHLEGKTDFKESFKPARTPTRASS